jgi:alcohol dehydrogenase
MADSASARALVLERPRRLALREIPLPDIGDDALVRVEACGLCGTDHEQYTGALAAGFAFVPGHETVGIVETIGPRAAVGSRNPLGCNVAGHR